MELKNIINHSSVSLSFSLLVCLFSLFLLSCIGFIFHISINVFYFPLSIIISQVVLYYLLRKKYNLTTKTFVINSLIFFIIILFSCVIAINFYDYSYDGRAYHQAGIMLLGQGWNPVYDNFMEFVHKHYPTPLYHLLWIENYTKFAETIQANIFILFDDIEVGKMTHYVSAVMLFLYSFYVFGKEAFSRLNLFSRSVISLILVLNPIWVAQSLTFYIDLYTYIFFMLILLSITDIETEGNNENHIPYLIIIMSSVCLLNIKFWGYIYLFTALFVYSMFLIPNKQYSRIKKLLISSLIILIMAIISGLNPYLTNLKQGRNIIYPVLGSQEAKMVMHMNIPNSFYNKNYLHLFLLSTFSKVDNFRLLDNKKHQLKLPFMTYSSEIRNLDMYDTRICGFGIFWSGILIVAFLLALFINYKKQKIYLIIFFILLFNILFQPYPWWARYIPQLWAFPVFVALYFLSEQDSSSTQRIITSFMLAIMFINSVIPYYYILQDSKAYKKVVNHNIFILIQKTKTIKIFTVCDWGIIEKLKENGIKTEFVSQEYFENNKDEFKPVLPQLKTVMYWKVNE